MDGQGDFGPQQVITTEANHPQTVLAADLDGDGDLDALAGFWNNNVSWYENMDGRGAFGPQRVITTAVNVCRSVYAADLDEDGDLDLLSASLLDDKIAWYENTDGAGSFGPQQVITTAADGAARSMQQTWTATATWMCSRSLQWTTRSPGTRTQTAPAASARSR